LNDVLIGPITIDKHSSYSEEKGLSD
jgi:hypothetical protein